LTEDLIFLYYIFTRSQIEKGWLASKPGGLEVEEALKGEVRAELADSW
jgi:hypothetical protein